MITKLIAGAAITIGALACYPAEAHADPQGCAFPTYMTNDICNPGALTWQAPGWVSVPGIPGTMGPQGGYTPRCDAYCTPSEIRNGIDR